MGLDACLYPYGYHIVRKPVIKSRYIKIKTRKEKYIIEYQMIFIGRVLILKS